MLPWKLRKRQILPVNQNLSSVYFSPAKFQLVSCNLSLAMIWQMTYTHKLPKLCSATLSTGSRVHSYARATFSFDAGLSLLYLSITYRVFSHDVTAAILVSQNNETAAMLVSQTSPVGVELLSYANAFFCSNKFA